MGKMSMKLVGAVMFLVAGPVCLQNAWPAVGRFSLVHLMGVVVAFAVALLGTAGLAIAYFIQRRDREAATTTRRRLKAYLLAAAAIPVAVVLSFGAARALPRRLPTGSGLRAFDSAAWVLAESEQSDANDSFTDHRPSSRQMMLREVVQKVLPGKSKSEIEALLGPSEDTEYFREISRNLIYRIGWERDKPWRVDSEWLLIWLDGDAKFLRYEVVTG